VLSDAFRQAAESKDFSAAEGLFSDDVVFRSPAVFKPYEGKEAMGMVLAAVVEVFEDFRYTDQIETGDTAALIFEARVGDRELNGVDVLRFDAEGRITELMVMVRPMSGLNALVEAMGAKLAEMGVPVPGR
jgi:ketosteroid isomerase-like protein